MTAAANAADKLNFSFPPWDAADKGTVGVREDNADILLVNIQVNLCNSGLRSIVALGSSRNVNRERMDFRSKEAYAVEQTEILLALVTIKTKKDFQGESTTRIGTNNDNNENSWSSSKQGKAQSLVPRHVCRPPS